MKIDKVILKNIGPHRDLAVDFKSGLIGILGANLQELNIPNEDEYAEAYYQKTNRNEIQNWDFFLAYNMFRLAGITQGIAGRVRDGTASSDQAKQYGAFVPILSQMAWKIVESIK